METLIEKGCKFLDKLLKDTFCHKDHKNSISVCITNGSWVYFNDDCNELIEEYLLISRESNDTCEFFGKISKSKFEIRWLYYLHCIHPLQYLADSQNELPIKFKVNIIKSLKGQLEFFTKLKRIFFFRHDLNRKTSFKFGYNRYLRFLDLIKQKKGVMVPTLDIDYIWHSHMLLPESYQKDMDNLMGKVLDHNDDIEASELKDCFTNTKKFYKNCFKSNYTYSCYDPSIYPLIGPCWYYCLPIRIKSGDKTNYTYSSCATPSIIFSCGTSGSSCGGSCGSSCSSCGGGSSCGS